MEITNKVKTSKCMSGDIKHLINDAIQNKLTNLSTTLS
ncbi:MAG: hypothetical protein ACI9U5_000849 [Colwellia sp.]|jgi:hypothetical protein